MSMRSVLPALAAVAAIGLAPLPVMAQTQGLPATAFNVVGSIGNLSMYLSREVPFWNETVPKESAGAIKVQLKSFTELGLKGPEIFRLVSSGTLQFATTVLNYNSGEVPMNEAADLVGLVGSVEELQKAVEVLRPSYAKFLEEKHGLKLLGFGSYQAQVIYCRDAFTNIADLKGRKVRASGASQQAFVSYIGGSPITIAFAEVQPALASGVIDCAITGALSGYRSKWHEIGEIHLADADQLRPRRPPCQSRMVENTGSEGSGLPGGQRQETRSLDLRTGQDRDPDRDRLQHRQRLMQGRPARGHETGRGDAGGRDPSQGCAGEGDHARLRKTLRRRLRRQLECDHRPVSRPQDGAMSPIPTASGIRLTTIDPAAYRHTPWKNGGGVTIDIAESLLPGFPPGSWEGMVWRFGRTAIVAPGPFSDLSGFDRAAGAGFRPGARA